MFNSRMTKNLLANKDNLFLSADNKLFLGSPLLEDMLWLTIN